MTLFMAGNWPVASTAPPTAITTGTSTKTMLQLLAGTTRPLKIVKWGVQFPTPPTAPVLCELIETGSVAATVTAHVSSGIPPYDRTVGTPVASVQLSTSGSGYTASAEGAITTSRIADLQVIPAGVGGAVWEWSLGREFEVANSRILRVRMTTATAASALCWVVWDE